MSGKWTADEMPDLTDQVAVVTGANSGIGYEAALELARHGAHVVFACRSEERGNQAIAAARDEVPDASVERMRLDLADLASIRAFSDAFHAAHDRLDLLVDNAGLMAIPQRETADGFEMQLGVNHFGHFALAGLLIDRVIASAPSRVVTVSSSAHRMGKMALDDLDHRNSYQRWTVYGQSKLANLLFAFELDRRLRARGLDVISAACHPGFAATELQTKGAKMEGSSLKEQFMRLGNALLAQDAAMGALPTLYAATAPDVEGGDFIGPDGLFERAGYPEKVRAKKAAYDEEAARRLWEISVERTGVDWAALD